VIDTPRTHGTLVTWRFTHMTRLNAMIFRPEIPGVAAGKENA